MGEELLHGEWFTDVQYSSTGGWAGKELPSDEVDITMLFARQLIVRLDAGDRITILAGGHVGCFELFGTDRVVGIRDLKGKTVAVREMGSPERVFLTSMEASVGLNPHKDINWVLHSAPESIKLLVEEKIDAFIALPPTPQELREKKIGHVAPF